MFSGALICSFIWAIFYLFVYLFVYLFIYLLSQCAYYVVRAEPSVFAGAGQPKFLGSDTVCGGGVGEGIMTLAQLLDVFLVTSPTTHSKLGSSGADCCVGGFVYVLGPCGSLQ